ncbi:MAG: sensor histidine kinase KdpD [Lachnospiraceae bacterium]|nr:sensor histidine kinase KdpD [Lachnospiraceae bacterium]
MNTDSLREDTAQIPEEIRGGDAVKIRGHLKIFFGYAAGVGKTHAMLSAARTAQARGTDVAAGYVEPYACPQTISLLNEFEQIPVQHMSSERGKVQEFDLDKALKRKPQLILVDELAHTNEKGCRHNKRYQDVQEMLSAGIDVYTTVNVQNIESLNDMVASITGEMVRDRIPDSVFDGADQVELVDIEPKELIERLKAGDACHGESENPLSSGFLTVEKLTALREIALRRCADRVNRISSQDRSRSNYHTDEHILVCLSSAPSNMKIIRTAARMAQAFRGIFTALFVETPDFQVMSEEDKKRLLANTQLAEQLGAKIETIYGEDIPYQIAEFARLSGVSKIVIGRSTAAKRHWPGKPSLTEKLTVYAPNLDIYIIPDQMGNGVYREKKQKKPLIVFCAQDILKCIAALLFATCLGLLFQKLGFTEANIITIYILSVLVIAVATTNRVYSLVSSIASVCIFNFLFTEPRYTLMAYDQGYPVTFLVMFLAAFMTGTLAARLKNHARKSAQTAYRTKILFDTDQLLGKSKGSGEIAHVAANQLVKLLGRDVVVYLSENGELTEPKIFTAEPETDIGQYVTEEERKVAAWVLKNNKHAGTTTNTFSNARCFYLAVRVNENVYGVVGIAVQEQQLDAFETSILLSILGECALALENDKNAREKEEAAVLAQNEQLRANLLRAISHDLRTPLTSISGNASNLLFNESNFDEETKHQLYSDIYDDSMWLINLVENLLAVTRIEEGRMNLRMAAELMDEVVAEALSHVNRNRVKHQIVVEDTGELLLAKIDARLIVQVFINIVDNAIKYTPEGSKIEIRTVKKGSWLEVSIADNGPGIPDEDKKHVFDMFYSGANKIADSRRSLGLGLALCRSIITAHGGEIRVSDNHPCGTVFTFTLPAEEVYIHE